MAGLVVQPCASTRQQSPPTSRNKDIQQSEHSSSGVIDEKKVNSMIETIRLVYPSHKWCVEDVRNVIAEAYRTADVDYEHTSLGIVNFQHHYFFFFSFFSHVFTLPLKK